MALSQKKVDESGENLETGIQGSDVNVEMVENGSANGGDAPSSKNDKNDNEVEASQPGFGSENEKQPKSNNNIPRQSSESEKQKLAEKQKSANEQSSTPLISDNYESLKEKEEAKKAAILGETKNVQETPPAPPPPIPVSPSNPAPEKEEEKESESDKESSRKKSNKKKKKKVSFFYRVPKMFD
uniref:Uncharacterized protein n=1 Tax=Panagrolaimus superbus TaxID=310955 RepID=A0A914Y3X8_9BILA